MTQGKLRLLFGLAAASALVALTVACGDDSTTATKTAAPAGSATGSTGASAAATTAPAGTKGGEITVQQTEPQSFDPTWSQFGQDISVERMAWRGLYRLDKDNKPQPEMAASAPQIAADGKTYTIKLRSGLKWSDGKPLLAKDFVAGLIRTCDPDNAGNYQYVVSDIVGCDDYYNPDNQKKTDAEKQALRDKVAVRAVDDLTVEIKLINAQPTFTIILALWATFPIPSHIVTTPGAKWPSVDKLAYNGPFKIQSYAAKDNVVLVRNDNYYGTQALLDKITMKFIDKLDVAENAYRAGQLQMTQANLVNLAVIKADPTLGKEYVQTARAATRAIHINQLHKPLDNYEVRLALAQATDRATLIKVAFNGAHVLSTTWMPPNVVAGGVTATSFAKTTGYDPEAAKKHLEKAGYPGGKDFPKLVFVISDTPDRKATAEFVKEQWKKILNIDIDVQVVDGKTRAARFLALDYDLFFGGWSQDYPDPENWVLGLWNTGGSGNHYGVSDPKLDELYKKAQFNTNDEERRAQWREINVLLSENPMDAGVVLYQESFNYLINPKLKGAKENATVQDGTLAGDWNAEAWSLSK